MAKTLTLADVMHSKGHIWDRPEYGRLSPEWAVIAFQRDPVLARFMHDFQRDRDIVISTGIKAVKHYQNIEARYWRQWLWKK